MKDSQFRDLVRRMRQAQREYFKTRNSGWLRLSKDLEKQVDDEIEPLYADERLNKDIAIALQGYYARHSRFYRDEDKADL